MATIETLQKRIDGAKKNIAKMEQKIARIIKAKESNWTVNPYWYTEDDLRSANKDLEYAKGQLAKYEEELATEIDKSRSRNVPAIIEFLENWKERVFSYYEEGLEKFYDEQEAVRELYNEWDRLSTEEAERKYKEAREAFNCKRNGYFVSVESSSCYSRYTCRKKIKDGEYEFLKPYCNYNKEEAYTRLKKDLENEANRKYDFIIERVNSICGTILDASGLSVGAKGDLNGVIIGEKGNAHVQTIGAGGYNIQVFHFRTLIKEIKR